MSKSKNITKEEIEKINDLFLNKKESIRGIAKQLGYSTSFINKILTKKEHNRFDKNKYYVAVCKKTNKSFDDYENKSGGLLKHIEQNYENVDVPTKFIRKKSFNETGIFWHELYFDIIEGVEKEQKKCKYCDWKTIDVNNKSGAYTNHLQENHQKSIETYINEYPEESFLFETFNVKKQRQNYLSESVENFIECKICGEKFGIINNTHLKKHNISKKEYKKKYGDTVSKVTHERLSLSSIESNKKLFSNNRKTNIEILIENKLKEISINYETQKSVDYYFYDFFLKDYSLFIEADGIYWHGHDRNENWNPKIIKNVINDYKKTNKVDKLSRIIEGISINTKNLNQISSLDSFFNFLQKESFDIKNHKLFNLKEFDVIIEKKHCFDKQEFFQDSGIINDLCFLMTNFYNPENYENFIDLNSRASEESRLKAIFFKQFYTASKIGNKNLFEIFENRHNLKKVIEYRLGINKSKEYFDISIKNIYRGIEVRNIFNVGILPIKQAKDIYNCFVKENNIVFDPFSGWASRMLGMENFIKEKNCTYIGLDSNKSLENGYKNIINNRFYENNKNVIINFSDSRVFHKNLENKIDFIFTSPPFYNDEIYTKEQEIFKTQDNWIEELIKPVFINCFNYCKTNSFIAIDMKELYLDKIEKCLSDVGFKFIERKSYKVNKSHYSKKDKNQYVTIFQKI